VSEESRIDRRVAIKWMLAASATTLLPRRRVFAGEAAPAARGYGTDPVVNRIYRPGDLWPLTFTPHQRRTATALCDLIIPADSASPAASKVGVPDFIDEWVSAPYPRQQHDRKIVLDGFAWLDAESQRRFGRDFASAYPNQSDAIARDICFVDKAAPEFRDAAIFFALYRDLTTGGFYTTPQGSKDIGYVGNVPLDEFEGPPRDLLQRMGLA
jgi:hypothetical protein